VREAKLRWVQQLWGHVIGNGYGSGHGVSFYDSGVGDDSLDPKASKACSILCSDQNVSLDGLEIGTVAVFDRLYLSPE